MFSVTVLNNRETTCGFWALDMGPLWLKTWISKFYIIVCIVKAMVFPVFMYGCEIWTIKKAECWRTDAFELWHWKRLLCSFDSKQIKPINPKENQSWLFIGRTDAEAETPNTLATWCEGLTHLRPQIQILLCLKTFLIILARIACLLLINFKTLS